MRAGFAKNDITPRVGVELAGFGPFRCRRSIGVRDRLWARAMAVEQNGATAVVIGCDLIGVTRSITARVREIVTERTGVPAEAIMVDGTHTHSGPSVGVFIGWGEPDPPYVETLPQRIAKAALAALERMQEATLSHAEAPCVGIGVNREYDHDRPSLEEALRDDWRPARPELTDTTCHVLRADAGGRMIGFAGYFGCHPVVCCAKNRCIHGDYAGVGTNLIEREHPGSVGLFLQGAQGDVNSCVVHQGEQESLLALDAIAARYANAVRQGLQSAEALAVDEIRFLSRDVPFSRKPWGIEKLRALLAESEARVHALDATDDYAADDRNIRMETVSLLSLRRLVTAAEAGESLTPPMEVQGIRLGPLALLGSPFETFQAIKNDVKSRAQSPIPLVLGLANDMGGYAVDRTAAARGGYAADQGPRIHGALPYANIHDELAAALLALDAELRQETRATASLP